MRTICIGDSFTKGFGVNADESWVSLLDTPCSTFINKGVNGDTTGGMLARFYSDAILESPNYLFITGGVNDFIAGANVTVPQANYMAMAHQAFHHNMIPVIGIQPGFSPDAVRDDWASFADFAKVAEKQQDFRSWIKAFCKTFGLFSVDFYGALENLRKENPATNYFQDGIHLTAEGHEAMSKIVVETMRSF